MSNAVSVSLKLLIDAKRGIVLFAETSQDVAAFISDVLAQPETVISLLRLRQQETAAATGSLANLSKSIQNVSEKSTYCCPNCCTFQYSDDPLAVCPHCSGYMDQMLEYVAPPKPPASEAPAYIITDDLEMMPMSAISIVTLFQRLRDKDACAAVAFEKKEVNLGIDEAIKLVSASLQSKQVLTDVFLKAESVKAEIGGNSDALGED